MKTAFVVALIIAAALPVAAHAYCEINCGTGDGGPVIPPSYTDAGLNIPPDTNPNQGETLFTRPLAPDYTHSENQYGTSSGPVTTEGEGGLGNIRNIVNTNIPAANFTPPPEPLPEPVPISEAQDTLLELTQIITTDPVFTDSNNTPAINTTVDIINAVAVIQENLATLAAPAKPADVVPPLSDVIPVKPADTPITEAINTTVNLINTTTSNTSTSAAPKSSSASTSNTTTDSKSENNVAAKTEEKKTDTVDTKVEEKSAKKNESAKKMYCN